MKSNIQNIELVKDFPCLMEYKLQGSIPVGIYLVNQIKEGGNEVDKKFSVCLVAPFDDISKLGEMYFKKDLNEKEWSFLPVGTSVNLIN